MDDVTGVILQYAAIAAMLIVLGFFARTLVVREQERADTLSEDLDRVNNLVQERVIGALLSATEATKESQRYIAEVERNGTSALKAIESLTLENSRLREDNAKLNKLVSDKIIPALINATTAIQASQQLLQAIQNEQEVERRLRQRLEQHLEQERQGH